ncbi:MAG: branched-chain amino acid ABC transporter permease [Natronomonas sp.]|uniref:branched-chain amino acid ABC transporter permease n=1 Tax=Natronomonas sp. TaxID=2184060 RepID=UPI002870334A|nr:branched-chain amino acid ABC transporter permease [Natronomonas sp.]MDR9381486.1 branched-chain amino acid ABC transporter permease [Natronomonas sp.]MDR9431044.1 branched-chain amino acid ABC transporter permease [Natronomonas sp.]
MVSIALLTELIVIGLFLGAFYGLIALGLSLVFGVQNIINLAHGEFVMLGAYAAFYVWALLSLSPIISLILSLPILFAFGAFLQWLLLERIQGNTELTSLILTFGLALSLRNLAQLVFSANYRSINYLTESVSILGADVSLNRPLGFGVALVITAVFFLFLRYSDWGKAIRATSQNPEIAKACGINTRHVRMVSFGLGAATAGAAGSIAGMLYTIQPYMGLQYLLKSFVVVVIGGLGSLVGAIIGGIGFGIVEAIGTNQLSSNEATMIAFILLVVVLIVRPKGLFGRSDAGED